MVYTFYNSMYRYKHVYTWYRCAYTTLPNPVHMVRIPDASLSFTVKSPSPAAAAAAELWWPGLRHRRALAVRRGWPGCEHWHDRTVTVTV